MATATIRIHGALNDFVAPARRERPISHAFDGQPGIKDVIEALGIPHPEVDLILVNGVPAGFDKRLHDGDRVSVHPSGPGPSVSASARVGPPPLQEPRFVVDGHLGRLAAYLRITASTPGIATMSPTKSSPAGAPRRTASC